MLIERAVFAFLTKLLLIVRSRLHSQARLQAEILVLQQQVLILGRKSPSRVRLRNLDRVILVWLYRIFPTLLGAITVVKPDTAIRWHRRGFRAYWRWRSRQVGGWPRIITRFGHYSAHEPRESAFGAHHGSTANCSCSESRPLNQP